MKRLARLLARFFPRSWRERYGVEFDAVLEDAVLRPSDLLDILKGVVLMRLSNFRLLGAFALVGLAVGLVAAYTIPKVYMTTTALRARNTTYDVRGVAAEVLGRRSLGEVIQKHGLYEQDQSRLPLEDLVERLRKDIKIQVGRDGATFVLQVRAASEQTAALVLNDLMDRFRSENHQGGVTVLDSPMKPIVLSPNLPMVTAAGILAGLVIGFAAVFRHRWPI